MTAWSTTTKHQPSEINNGNKYSVDDNVSLEELNATVENSLYAIDVAEHTVVDFTEVTEGVGGVNPLDNYYTKSQTQNLISNPNLLINGDFRVNQRGQSSYTSTGYTVDRWRNSGFSNLTVTPTDNGITLSDTVDTGTGIVLSYKMEDKDYLKLQGKTVTFSFNVTSNGNCNIYLRLLVNGSSVGDTTGSSATGIFSQTVTLTSSITSLELQIRKSSGTLGCSIQYVKLEIGSIATPYSPRPYAEELALCQRYYQINRAFKTARNEYNFYEPYLSFKTEMRVSPTIIGVYAVSGGGVVSSNDKTYYEIATNTEISASTNPYGYQSKYGLVLSNGSGTFTANRQYYCQVTCDAEIY